MVITEAAAFGSRALLQASNASSSDSSTNLPQAAECSGIACLIFNILVIVIMIFIVFLIFAYAGYKKWKWSRAIKLGRLPANYLISMFSVPPTERENLKHFSFPVRRPKNREEINEEACPICLKDKPKPASWLVFGNCEGTHACCNSCFKKLVADQKLLAACPICRTQLATGENTIKPITSSVEQPVVASEPTPTPTTTTSAAVVVAPLPPSDNNV
jgi:hypothetical protein